MRLIKTTLGFLVILYLTAVAAMFVLQRSLQYFPSQRAPLPAQVGLDGVEVVDLETADGVTVQYWRAKAAPGRPTILFFHGNAGEVANRAPRLAAYQAAGLGAAFLSYRGYGGSGGSPSEAGLLQDARAVYYDLLASGLTHQQIIVVGESLGTGVAVQLASSVPMAAIILEAPYSAAVDIAAAAYPWLPVRLLMKDQFRSIDAVPFVTAPLLVLHGSDDRVIPHASGRTLFDAAPEPKTFVTLPGAGHDALFDPAIWAQEIAFIDGLPPP